MAYYALLNENNVVIQVITGIDENEKIEGLTPEEWYGKFHNAKCVRTSFNNRIRKQYAGIGFQYDQINDVFIVPQPFPSWTLNENFDWIAPIPQPEIGRWIWNEESQNWINAETL